MSKSENRRIARPLPVKLTDVEKLDVGDKLAAVGVEIEALNEKVRKINADKRPKVKLALELTRKLHAGTEEREILCDVIRGPGVNIRFVRVDTGETVETRSMTEEERQLDLEGEDWLSATEKRIAEERAEAQAYDGGAAGEDEADDDEPENVVPLAGRSKAKKAARKPKGKGGKGRKR